MIFKNQGKVVKKYREAKGLTQKEVTDHLGFKSPQFISNIERGLAAIPFYAIKDLYFIPKNKLIAAMVKDYELSLKQEIKKKHPRGRRSKPVLQETQELSLDTTYDYESETIDAEIASNKINRSNLPS